ncbi:cytochrome b/b6 domain-containing protein [Azospirillum brasilense]|uniref:cytochrome b/b6 domain-containing protein n=1 Tax=Azospirillum brasilense TaxID=192 RepID=UPI000E696F69|nr:cytochrome b/b6 domain-containing protein [Azospirillum brasilense]NUB29628.1 cytochrome B [Azospirillum brasilense]RIW06001.1 cytochrome B [Azospirillum brasilense]
MVVGNTTNRTKARREVAVWDLPTRLFHWSLVLLVTVAVVSAKTDRMTIHMLAGEAILALLLFRLVWGLIGSQTARFSHFVKGPRAVLAYACGMLRAGRSGTEPKPIVGHNPMGGLMVLALLGALTLQAVAGLFTTDDILVDGPLVAQASGAMVAGFSTLHRVLADGILILIGVHVLAVLAYLLVKRDNLIRPMVTGRKAIPADAPVESPKRRPVALALAVLAAAAGLVAAVVQAG